MPGGETASPSGQRVRSLDRTRGTSRLKGRLTGQDCQVSLKRYPDTKKNSTPEFALLPFPSNAQRVGDAVDVVEPGRNQGDLQDGLILETAAGNFSWSSSDLGGVLRELHDVIDHDALLRRDGSGGVIAFQRLDQFFIKRDATQKLCVGFDSIHAPVGHRDHGGDHLVMAALSGRSGDISAPKVEKACYSACGISECEVTIREPPPSTGWTGTAYSCG